MRVWLKTAVLFEPASDDPATERLTDDGKARLDSAIGSYLEQLTTGVLVVEGYAQRGPSDNQYLRSRIKASLVRDYLLAKFYLTPQTTGVMPLGRDSAGVRMARCGTASHSRSSKTTMPRRNEDENDCALTRACPRSQRATGLFFRPKKIPTRSPSAAPHAPPIA